MKLRIMQRDGRAQERRFQYVSTGQGSSRAPLAFCCCTRAISNPVRLLCAPRRSQGRAEPQRFRISSDDFCKEAGVCQNRTHGLDE
jgi:hypothetical protein